MEITTKNAEETFEFGKGVAADLINKRGGSQIILLNGDLGAGKTTFVQGFANFLGVKEWILSPTFILIREYILSLDKYNKLYHLDLYRLDSNVKNQVKEIGLDEILKDTSNILLVEWADKLDDYFPKNATTINFVALDENTRKIKKVK